MKKELTKICKEDLKGIEINTLPLEFLEKGYQTASEIIRKSGLKSEYCGGGNWGRCVWSQCVYRT